MDARTTTTLRRARRNGRSQRSSWHRQRYVEPPSKVYKPTLVLTEPSQRALANQPWKEFTAEGGRKYWYNNDTRESTWEMPEEYKSALGASITPNASLPPIPVAPAGGFPNQGYDQPRDRGDRGDRGHEPRHAPYSSDPRAQAFVPATDEPEYASPEEAEGVFMKLLRRSGVQTDWTWEQTIRAAGRDPQFRAIKDPKERKAAFEKYCHEMISQDKERAHERLTKLRADFETMLKRHPEITHYTRWKTARPMIEGETLFRTTDNEDERRQLFEEYRIGLKKAHMEQQTTMRKNAMDGLIELLPKLNLEPYTRWSDAQGLISSTPPFQKDEKYKALTQFDILTAFQNHMKALERAFNDAKQEEKNKKFRRERKARDAFKGLLDELRKSSKINAGTKWSQLVPTIEKDERYIGMAALGGSTPQELFWDVIEDEERRLRGPRNDVIDVLEVCVAVVCPWRETTC
jgi:pre-mRNA-processing factor 40